MLPWRFLVYVAPSGRSDVQQTIDRFTDVELEYFKAHVRYLAYAERQDWRRPRAAKLRIYTELFEIRFKAGSRQHRPTGFFGPGSGCFTITLHCIEKGNVYLPHDGFKIADARRVALLQGQGTTAPLQVDGEDFPPLS